MRAEGVEFPDKPEGPIAAALVLVALGVIGTFPTFFQAFAP